MQKVITISTHTNIIDNEKKYTEKEYDLLNSYLEDGYKVVEVIPVTPSSTETFMYSLTFVLNKD